ncbi:hypothetical protein BT69DRAFT_1290923, partial [Atractiella rhizophila]
TDVWARQYVLRHTTVKGIQLFSLVYPPLLLAGMAWKRSFSVGRFMRNSALVGLGGGAAFGALAGWGRLRSVEEEGVRDRAERLRANWGQVCLLFACDLFFGLMIAREECFECFG